MPLSHFLCPDGETIEIPDCIAECRMARRCATLPYLVQVGKDREWDGTPHVTQLIQGTMESFLKITNQYSIEPAGPSAAFMSLGIAYHAQIEEGAKELGHPAEVSFKIPGFLQGSADYLEPLPDGRYDLWDYKTWGSFAYAKSRGIVAARVKIGKYTEYRRSYDPYKVDQEDIQLQMNAYRIWLSKELDIEIRDMHVQATIRDGNTMVAKNRGVTESVGVVDVGRLEDEYVIKYFTLKGEALKRALDTWQRKQDMGPEFEPIPGDAEPILCSRKETWEGMKCKNYCPVAYACPVGVQFS